MTMKNNTILYQ